MEIARRPVGEEILTVRQREAVQIQNSLLRISLGGFERPAVGPLEAPVERPHHAVRGFRGEFVLPRVHAASVPGFDHEIPGYQTRYRRKRSSTLIRAVLRASGRFRYSTKGTMASRRVTIAGSSFGVVASAASSSI